MAKGVPKDRWTARAGNYAAYTIELPFDPTGYTGWKSQFRPAPLPEDTYVELHVDDSLLGDATPAIRFYFDNGELLVTMDGWTGDVQVTDPDGNDMTLVEVDLTVEPDYTQ